MVIDKEQGTRADGDSVRYAYNTGGMSQKRSVQEA